MNWQQVCEEPTLQDLPFKIELNEHGRYQMRLGAILTQHISDGEVISECSVETSKGVKVADIAWISGSFLSRYGYRTPYPQSPEICVEIASLSNSSKELSEKRELYFQQGAKEVWMCDSFGNIDFFDITGAIPESKLISNFPDHI